MRNFSHGGALQLQPRHQEDIMQMWRIFILLLNQIAAISGLRVIDTGVGLPVYGAKEDIVTDFASLAGDPKSNLPSQVSLIKL